MSPGSEYNLQLSPWPSTCWPSRSSYTDLQCAQLGHSWAVLSLVLGLCCWWQEQCEGEWSHVTRESHLLPPLSIVKTLCFIWPEQICDVSRKLPTPQTHQCLGETNNSESYNTWWTQQFHKWLVATVATTRQLCGTRISTGSASCTTVSHKSANLVLHRCPQRTNFSEIYRQLFSSNTAASSQENCEEQWDRS